MYIHKHKHKYIYPALNPLIFLLGKDPQIFLLNVMLMNASSQLMPLEDKIIVDSIRLDYIILD